MTSQSLASRFGTSELFNFAEGSECPGTFPKFVFSHLHRVPFVKKVYLSWSKKKTPYIKVRQISFWGGISLNPWVIYWGPPIKYLRTQRLTHPRLLNIEWWVKLGHRERRQTDVTDSLTAADADTTVPLDRKTSCRMLQHQKAKSRISNDRLK